MIVETIAVGTELLLGQITNRNASDIGARLADAGFDHYRQVVVGDNLGRMIEAIREAVDRSDAVIMTGGIGPTQDDITREALCVAAGVPMLFDEQYAEEMREMWRQRGRPMPESNLRQAERPEGSQPLPNPKGSAPGVQMRIGETWVFAVPGVPSEMRTMIDTHVIPFLRTVGGGAAVTVHSRLLRTWGESEGWVGEQVADLYASLKNPTLAFLASAGEIKVRLTAQAPDRAAAETLIAPVEAEIRSRLGDRVFGVDDETIEIVLARELAMRGWSIATAESATGGLVASRIAGVPGISAQFRGSVVAYATDLKTQLLAVDAGIIDRHGVVSEATAVAMAEGAAERLSADVAVAVTGSAGPEPQDRPVGTIVIAVRTPEGTHAHTMRMPGDRERVRTYAATAALHLARLAIVGSWWPDPVEDVVR